MAQQGPPPRRRGRHSAPAPQAGQHDADPLETDPLEADERGSSPQQAGPYAADPYAADPYATDSYPADPSGAPDPFAAGGRGAPRYGPPDDPYAPRDDPYGREDPYGGEDPYAARVPDPRHGDPRSADPYGGGSLEEDPLGAEPYRARRAAPAPVASAPVAPAPLAPAPVPAGPARRAAGRPGSQPDRVSPWAQDDPFTADADEGDPPPWAGLTARPARAAGTRARPGRDGREDEADEAEAGDGDPAVPAGAPRRRGLGRGRAAAARNRKSRRRVWVYCGAAVILAVAVAAFFAVRALPKHKTASTFITSLQPGEFATVSSACASVGPDLLTTYLPGKVTTVNPAGASASYSQCSLTVDRAPEFRVLGVTAQAYQPSAVAAGNGSATDNAIDSYVLAEQTLRAPGKKSALPAAAITPVTGLGAEAFSAVQVIHAGAVVNDLVTVLARQRNVVVTVTFQAQAAGHGFGPVDVSTLQAGAAATARAVLQKDTAPAAAG